MNTIVLNILSKNNLLVEREQFQLEFIESLFQNLISQEEIDESIKVSSIFGTFFNENISLVEGETYKISVTTKKEQIFGIAVQSLFRKALNKESITNKKIDVVIKGILSNERVWSGYYNHDEIMNLENVPNRYFIKIVTPIFYDNKSIHSFDKIFKVISSEFEKHQNISLDTEAIIDSIVIKKERFYTKKVYINKKQEESYLGDVELSVMSNYAWELMSILEFAKYNGIGQKNKLGYGQILLKY